MTHRIRPLALALLALLSASALHAQPSLQTVRGRVVDAATNQPVSTASVRVVEESGQAAVTGQTDFGGRFNVRVPIAGSYRVTAERIGYAVYTSDVIAVARGANVEVDVRMTAVALALDSVGVRVRQTPPFRDARAGRFWERADRRRGTYLTPDQIAGRPYVGTTDLLRDMQNIYLEGDPNRGTRLFIGSSAIRRCVPTLYIDGRRRKIEEDERLDDYVDRKNLWAVEIYPEAADAPSELPPDDNFFCGVVAIWTRNA